MVSNEILNNTNQAISRPIIMDQEATDNRLVLPDILSKSRSGDSDSTQLKVESKQESEKVVNDNEQRRSSNYMTSEIKYYQSSHHSSGQKQGGSSLKNHHSHQRYDQD
jgi:hypothetical protein